MRNGVGGDALADGPEPGAQRMPEPRGPGGGGTRREQKKTNGFPELLLFFIFRPKNKK